MANVVYQPVAGRLRINSGDFSLEDISMYYRSFGDDYQITLFSKTFGTQYNKEN
jgi:hypothetical protein